MKLKAIALASLSLFGSNVHASEQKIWEIDTDEGWATAPLATKFGDEADSLKMDTLITRQVYQAYGDVYFITPIFVRWLDNNKHEEICNETKKGNWNTLPIEVSGEWITMSYWCSNDTIAYMPQKGRDRANLDNIFKRSRTVTVFGHEVTATGYTATNSQLKNMYGLR
ncbi:hypothetical protein [Vibrio pomeroyi]|uniref:hypothetical protein n=1 Tax=Vibrio pomeroyi TaxID=198832 RepID=UPI0021C4B0E2|nr:hypothetical protein [Vibrio pomeroyi]